MENSQAALANLQTQQTQALNPNDILKQQRDQLGVTGAQETVKGLRGAINNTTKLLKQVAPSVMGRTQSSLVTNAQAQKQIQNEQAPIAQNLSDQGQEYNIASQDLNQLERDASQAASGIYQGQQDKLSYLQNIYNSLFQREQAEKEAARQEATRQEQIRQFNEELALRKAAEGRAARASSGGGFSLGGSTGGGGGTTSPAAATSPEQQNAYNDVRSRVGRDNDQALQSDYVATASSAKNGNATDRMKLQIYRQLRPDLFKFKYSWE